MTNLKVYTNSRTVATGETSVEDLKLREFDRADRDIRTFIAEHDTLMQNFFDLIDTYNTSVLDVRDEVRSAAGDDPLQIGKFKRGKRPEYVKYDPSKMDVDVIQTLIHSGAVKVDTKSLEALVVRGNIPSDSVVGAKTFESGSFRVSGPKAIEFNL